MSPERPSIKELDALLGVVQLVEENREELFEPGSLMETEFLLAKDFVERQYDGGGT